MICRMYKIIQKILFLLPAETAHHVSLQSLAWLNKLGLLGLLTPKSSQQAVEVMGIRFPHRVGLAAGLDKNGDYIQALSNLGFGFVEIGTVTPRPQPGNPSPRLFRLSKAEAIINRMGFNNKGINHLVDNVNSARKAGYQGVIGINIGKNVDTPVEKASDDYISCLKTAYPVADYITINISSPNTPGLRSLQYGKELNDLLADLKREQLALEKQYNKYTPIAIKVAPDLSAKEIKEVAQALLTNKMDALIATNTTLSRDAVTGMKHADEAGGLSGRPVRELSTDVIRQFHQYLKKDIPIIGVGGISSPQDAQDKIEAGASLVQIYTGFIYHGPSLIWACSE